MGRGPKPAKSRVETKPPIVRKSRKSESARAHDLEKRLAAATKRETEALEQQTATSDILRVISGSATDVRPVFDAILTAPSRSATRRSVSSSVSKTASSTSQPSRGRLGTSRSRRQHWINLAV